VLLSLVTHDQIPWDLRGKEEGVWILVKNGAGGGGRLLASTAYIDGEEKWLLIMIPVMGTSIILGQIVAAFVTNFLFSILAAFAVIVPFTMGETRHRAWGMRSVYGTFRARLTISLFVFFSYPDSHMGCLEPGGYTGKD